MNKKYHIMEGGGFFVLLCDLEILILIIVVRTAE